MNIQQLFTLATLSLLSLSAFGGGSHGGGHSEKPKSECTEEHAAMGHCMMEGDGQHGHQSPVGKPANISDATETIHVTALDTMRFEFDKQFEIKPGKTINFVVVNKGKLRHEFSIGDVSDQMNHAEAMMKNPGMMHGDGEAAITLEAGETKSLAWTFAGNEEVVFACTLPGHYQAGMLHKQKMIH